MKRLLFIVLMISGAISIFAQTPTVGELIHIFNVKNEERNIRSNHLLQGNGYEPKFNERDGSYNYIIYSRNCRVVREDSRNGMAFHPDRENADASIIVAYVPKGKKILKALEVQVYSKAQMRRWVGELRSLGYKSTDGSGIGNQGRSWEYAAPGKPFITIWNDHSNTYILSIGFDRMY